jgi:hypothetical protein
MENVLEKLKEQNTVWESIDTRKVTNRSDVTVPRVIIEGIESKGITTEQLVGFAKDFPVFFYKTQVTLHGLFPTSMSANSHGYKNLIVNQNRSLGIRYSAVDAEKKIRLAKFCKPCGVHSYRSSTVFYLARGFRDDTQNVITKELVLANYAKATEWVKTINKDLFTGCIVTGHVPYTGEVFVLLHVNSLPEANVVPLIENLTGRTLADIEQVIAAKELENKDFWDKFKKENEEKAAKENAELEAKVATDQRPNLDPATLANGEGCIVELLSTYYGMSGHWAVWKDKKSGELRAYKLEYHDDKDTCKVNMLKRSPAPWKAWQKNAVVKIHRHVK